MVGRWWQEISTGFLLIESMRDKLGEVNSEMLHIHPFTSMDFPVEINLVVVAKFVPME